MAQNILRPFHIAFPIKNIPETKEWYPKILGCSIGRESDSWVEFNFFGHQISGHLTINDSPSVSKNEVDSKQVPIRHFGVILTISNWKTLADKLIAMNIDFIINPYTRFKGKRGEQSTFLIKDPSNNFLEFKAFNDDDIFSN